ncbi:unnamed protein product [Arabidopsis halleri]
MEKISMKRAFLIFLVVISAMDIVTIQNVEAKRLLREEIPQMMLHHEVSTQVIRPQNLLHCEKGCRVKCVPNPFIVECFCFC